MDAIKAYLKRAVDYLKENGQEDSIKVFRAKATEFVKFVVSNFSKFTFYVGKSGDKTGAIAHCYSKDEDESNIKTIAFLNVALSEAKL